jgi:tRNA threonylcarbamoyladenosine biosynthesis protein TsaB
MNTPLILHIETATPVCSVAISAGSNCLVLRELDEPNIHASQLTVLIEQTLAEGGYSFADLAAVSVSKGPGSYTGLRIGVSTAKGLCYALDIPLLAVHTLDAMAGGFARQNPERMAPDVLLMPMIDARRMEVYTAAYGSSLDRVVDVAAQIIDGESFAQYIDSRQIVLFGSGADKFVELFAGQEAVSVIPGFKNSATHLVGLADEAYRQGRFEDVAYFEPFYLKEFVATTPRA